MTLLPTSPVPPVTRTSTDAEVSEVSVMSFSVDADRIGP